MTGRIVRFDELRVYDRAFALAMEIFRHSAHFPIEERFPLTDQIRRSSRSVCANVAEGWHKRRYPAAFAAKLSDAEAEAGETIVWLNFACACGCLSEQLTAELKDGYDQVLGMLIRMIDQRDKWILPGNYAQLSPILPGVRLPFLPLSHSPPCPLNPSEPPDARRAAASTPDVRPTPCASLLG